MKIHIKLHQFYFKWLLLTYTQFDIAYIKHILYNIRYKINYIILHGYILPSFLLYLKCIYILLISRCH